MSLYRFFELVPAILAWSSLIIVVAASRYLPTAAAIFIILFDTYWLLKTIYLSLHLRYSFLKMRQYLKIDWLAKIKELAGWQDVYHLVILPMYKEPYSVVKESFDSLRRMNYSKDRFIVVLSAEERGGEEAQEVLRKIETEFGQDFFKFMTTTHPAGLPGELPGKGSHETWAAKVAKREIIDPAGIDYEKILVSVFDVDTQVPPDYFGRLTYCFLTAEHPQRSSYQPIPLFHNNIYEAPVFARVVALSASFWHMMQQARPERLRTFSSHSMPFKALTEIGWWQTDIVSEDSRIFWQCYLHYDGDWRTVPLFYPVSMDANVAPTFWGTMANVYRQQRRWGWGIENIPYILHGFVKNKVIPLRRKLYWSFHETEGFHSWATNSLIIFALGWLPIFLGGEIFNETILSFSLPKITRTIMTLAMVGIASSAILGLLLLPPKPEWFKRRHYFLYLFQWVLIPVTLIVFGAFPALESQTRLALGGRFRLGFWFTPKSRHEPKAGKEEE
ncbi:MAG: glycosyltransferase family 2 protein [Candidatus Colwellbacteria bacterium]|nr:glycosyltransferase family 2 protein [Candidatus Colwellbacteria bacterium]